ncbi:hypothetical protein D3Z47_20875 [Lachnospiraceae bacterium]|nr:hypothetical protein [Lachnospiraceae bacterium]
MQKQNEETANQMAVVASYNGETGEITAIEGNSANEVRENTYQAAADYVVSYLKMAELEEAYRLSTAAPADTQKPQNKKKASKEAPNGNILTGDEAYVDSIEVSHIVDGIEPFDGDDAQGNDSNSSNLRVRTFDTVTYNFLVRMKSWDSSKTYDDARVKMEFVLPVPKNEAVFDETAMAWMDQTEGYKPEIKEETRMIDGKEVQCQVLTGYRHLIPSSDGLSVIPGEFGNNVTINVKAMRNGQQFQPIFSAAMEGGTWDGPCQNEDHKDANGAQMLEKKTVMPDQVTVTAAPKYNIFIEGDGSYKDTFDFSTGYGTAANQDKGNVTGRMMKMGIVLQLYNDNASKGLKGIELPNGEPITFDVDVSSVFQINTPAAGTEYDRNQRVDVTANYTPLLWGFDANKNNGHGGADQNGRILKDYLWCAPYVPYNYAGGNGSLINTCWNSGNWQAQQEGSKIHFTVSGYEINPEHMPIKNGDYGDDMYGANVGCFSAGQMFIVQPYNKIHSGSQDPYFDIVTEYGEGAFATTVKVSNLQAVTMSGQPVKQGENGFEQMRNDDDERTRTLELTLPGSLQNRVKYNRVEDFNKGVGVDNDRDGRDYTVLGSEIEMMGGFTYDCNNEPVNQLYWGTNLMKFYGSAIKPDGTYKTDLNGSASLDGKTQQSELENNVFIYYATKKDGTDWTSDHELQGTYEYDLKFYKDLKDIPKGHICVGILTCFKGPGALISGTSPAYTVHHKAKVENHDSLVGDTFMLASSSRVWTKEMCQKSGISLDQLPIDWTKDASSQFHGMSDDHLKSANFDPNNTHSHSWSTWYTKETYKPDGSGIYGTHNSDWSHWGDTLLIIGYKSGVTKNLLQKNKDGQIKQVFDMDTNQRVADFKLQPSTKFEKEGSFDIKTVVTVVDTLPKYMRYKAGSGYFGGTYNQTSEVGGTMGEITGGTLREPDVTENPDGTQTLKWTITDVVVGQPMEAIYYSVDIGTKGNPDADVPSGTTTELKNTVFITAAGDMREPTLDNGNYAEAGISVTRGSANSFGKYTKQKIVEEDGTIDYVVYFNNNSTNAAKAVLMDTMPADKINRSNFNGTYEFTKWKLDVTKCNREAVQIYYTMEEQYKDKVLKEVSEDTIQATWTQAAVAEDGSIALPAVNDSGRHPVAWAVIGTLQDSQSIFIDLEITLYPEKSDATNDKTNYFVNTLSCGDTTTTTETPTVRRILEGLTWLDYNRDGLQNEEDTDRISGVKVELLKFKGIGSSDNESEYEPVCYPGTDQPIIIETGQQVSLRADGPSEITWYGTDTKAGTTEAGPKESRGRYKFIDLPEGVFAVRFSDGTGQYKISQLHATLTDNGSTDAEEAIDSDGIPVYDRDGNLKKTIILNLDMPSIENMFVSVYTSQNHDSGFYPDTVIKIQKTDETGNRNLSGAIFTIRDSKGSLLSFTADEGKEGSYTLSQLNQEEISALSGKSYIAFADNPNLVLGFDGTGDGALPSLKNRNGSESQLFEVHELNDGCIAFRNAAGRWIDLDGGSLSNGAKIHLWSNLQPNDNQKWRFVKGQDGTGRITPKSSGGYSIDVTGAVSEVNRGVHLWENNDSIAQKWILLPAGNSEETQTDLSVGTDGSLVINDLAPGEYSIAEIKSPNGYSILKEPVKINLQKNGKVAIISNEGNMAEVIGTDNDLQVRIRNNELYELPNAGGSGIYWYAVSGVLLMLAGVWKGFRMKYSVR